MKIAIIAPTPYLEKYSSMWTMQMCLGFQAWEDKEYLDFFKRKQEEGQFVLCDNWAHEGRRIDWENLVSLARDIKPSCVILPDVLDNYIDTKKDTLEFYEKYGKDVLNLGVEMMAVPQGQSFEQFLDNYKTFTALEWVNYIWISYTILFNDIPWFEKDLENCKSKTEQQLKRRFYLIKYLYDHNLIDHSKKHHLLGLANPMEFELYNTFLWNTEFLHSSDSALAYVNWKAERAIDSQFWVIWERQPSLEDFSESEITSDSQEQTVIHNTKVILWFAERLNRKKQEKLSTTQLDKDDTHKLLKI